MQQMWKPHIPHSIKIYLSNLQDAITLARQFLIDLKSKAAV